MVVYLYGDVLKLGPTVRFCVRNVQSFCSFDKEQGRMDELLNSIANPKFCFHKTPQIMQTSAYEFIQVNFTSTNRMYIFDFVS